MPKDVLITPLSAKVEFKDTNSTLDGLIQLDASDNLSITSPNGTLVLGNAASNISIGDGTATVNMIFQQSGSLSAVTGSTLTLGSSTSGLTFGGPTSLNQELIIGTATNSRIRFTNNTGNIYLRTLTTGTVSFEGTSGQLFSITDSMSGTIFSVNDISGIPSIEVLDTGLIKLNQYNGQTVIGGSSAAGTAELTVYPSAAANIGLVVKGFTSQSENLTEWQNSSGTILGKITSAGYFGISNLVATNGSTPRLQVSTGTTYNILIEPVSTTTVGLVIKGLASQTGNLQEWQNSSGTVLTSISSAGVVTAPSFVPSGSTVPTNGMYLSAANTLAFATNSTRRATISSAGQMALDGTLLVGQGVGSSTAFVEVGLGRSADGISYIDLISDTTYTDFGTRVLRGSGSNGEFSITNRGTGGIAIRSNEAATILFATTNTTRMTIAATGEVGIGASPITTKMLYVNTVSAANTGFLVRGVASQTGNLQEWQNSAGSILATVNASGQFVGDGSQLTGISAGANEIMVIMGAY